MGFNAQWLAMLAEIEQSTGADGLDRLERLTEQALAGGALLRKDWRDFDRFLIGAGFDRGSSASLADLRSALMLKAVQRIESEAVLSRQRLYPARRIQARRCRSHRRRAARAGGSSGAVRPQE